MNSQLTGLIAAPFTPMCVNGEVNLDVIEQYAAWLTQQAVSGAFICGSTGESLSLSLAERLAIAERWCQVAGKALPVIVHVGHTCVADARRLAAHAQQIGAAAIATMAPCFFRPSRMAELVEFCAQIANAAPQLPFYFYHMPSMTGVNFSMVDFLNAAKERIPTLAGIKFTDEDIMDYSRCLNIDGGRFTMLFGRDEILLSALAVGARGAVGSTYNYAAPIYHRLIAAFQHGDIKTAQQEQARACEMIALLGQFGGLPAGKAIMKMQGIDCGPVRLPLRTLTDAEYTQLKHALDACGFFSACCA